MGFLDGIHNIVMDIPNVGVDRFRPEFYARSIPLDDMKRLHDAGAGAVYQWLPWFYVEPRLGVYDWSLPDEMVSRSIAAGMKVILLAPSGAPDYFPEEWYCRYADNVIANRPHPKNVAQTWPCLSPWNRAAVEYQLRMIERCCERYNSDDVLVTCCQSQDGEALLPPASAAIYDTHAIESYRHWVGDNAAYPYADSQGGARWMFESVASLLLEQQDIYVRNATKTIMCNLHPVYIRWPGAAVYDIWSYFHALRVGTNPGELLWTIFQYYEGGFEKLWPLIDEVCAAYNARLITGSQYADGLLRHTAHSRENGTHALLTSVLHPFQHKDAVLDSDIDAMRYSASLWRGI